MRKLNVLGAFVTSVVLTLPLSAEAHEFWLEADDYTIDQGAELRADIRVGQDFKGNASPYLKGLFKRFDIVTAQGVLPVQGRIGDMPAAKLVAADDGLATLVHVTTPLKLTYKEAEKFSHFLEYEGLTGIAEEHTARGLPAVGFAESYTRFAKALIAVGSGQGKDRPIGLRWELVALDNPYITDGPVPVRILFEGVPAAGIQFNVFTRAPDGSVTLERYFSDANGVANVPAPSGHTVMVNAVKMVRPAPALAEEKGVVWHSLWANLTFARD